MNEAEVEFFESVEAQLQSAYKEIGALSAKKPDDPVNKFKLKLVNRVLDAANDLLEDDRPFQDFRQFEQDDLPTNSDVVFILSQYLHNLEDVRSNNIVAEWDDQGKNKEWWWIIDGQTSDRRAAPPAKLKK
jgi:hypothetical protein